MMFNKLLSTHFKDLTAKVRGLNDRCLCWSIIDLTMEPAPEVRDKGEGPYIEHGDHMRMIKTRELPYFEGTSIHFPSYCPSFSKISRLVDHLWGDEHP